jgi:hypothetical protein
MKSRAPATTEPPVSGSEDQERQSRYSQAAELLREWQDDESGYDEEIWPLLDEDLPSLRMRCPE